MNKNIGLVSLFASALLFSAACSDDEDNGGGGDTVDASNPAVDAMGGGGTVDAAPIPVDAAPTPDAMPAALACAGDPLPTMVANPPITVAGDVQEVTLGGASTLTAETAIGLHNVVDDMVIVNGDFTGGTFSLVGPDISTPLDAYIKATTAGHVDTYIFPGAALSENITNAPLLMLADSVFGFLPTLSGVPNVTDTGTFTAAILDCNDNPIAGAVLTISPDMGTIQYGDASGLPGGVSGPTATLDAGVVYVFNVPPGEYTISVDVGGTALRTNTVKSFANGVSTIQIIP